MSRFASRTGVPPTVADANSLLQYHCHSLVVERHLVFAQVDLVIVVVVVVAAAADSFG
jgi:hypothetical protein